MSKRGAISKSESYDNYQNYKRILRELIAPHGLRWKRVWGQSPLINGPGLLSPFYFELKNHPNEKTLQDVLRRYDFFLRLEALGMRAECELDFWHLNKPPDPVLHMKVKVQAGEIDVLYFLDTLSTEVEGHVFPELLSFDRINRLNVIM